MFAVVLERVGLEIRRLGSWVRKLGRWAGEMAMRRGEILGGTWVAMREIFPER